MALTARQQETLEDLEIYDIYKAASLIAYGVPFIAVTQKWDAEKKKNLFCFVFKNSLDAQNILLLYNRQLEFLMVERDKYVDITKKKIHADMAKFGGVKNAFKESTKRIKGAPQKSNGVWKG